MIFNYRVFLFSSGNGSKNASDPVMIWADLWKHKRKYRATESEGQEEDGSSKTVPKIKDRALRLTAIVLRDLFRQAGAREHEVVRIVQKEGKKSVDIFCVIYCLNLRKIKAVIGKPYGKKGLLMQI